MEIKVLTCNEHKNALLVIIFDFLLLRCESCSTTKLPPRNSVADVMNVKISHEN